MSSGLFNYSEDETFLTALDTNPEREYRPVELVGIALNNNSYFKPGKGWYYTNTNYVLLGLIAEYVTKRLLSSYTTA